MRPSAIATVALLSGLVLWLAAGPARAQIVLEGTYLGMGEAAGARLEIAPDPGGFRGSWRPAGGAAQSFEADRRGDQAETVVTLSGRAHLMQVTPLPWGAEVALIPFNQDGTLALDGARLAGYRREGVAAPEPPEGFVPAPRDPAVQITANSFLSSYEFWRPQGVLAGYLALPPRSRTMIRLFPAVQLDVIWKLCLAPRSDRALALALKGQGVNCAEVVSGLAEVQSAGRFDAYKREVAEERDALIVSVRCGEGYVMRRADCRAAAERMARQALSLETAASVLARHR